MKDEKGVRPLEFKDLFLLAGLGLSDKQRSRVIEWINRNLHLGISEASQLKLEGNVVIVEDRGRRYRLYRDGSIIGEVTENNIRYIFDYGRKPVAEKLAKEVTDTLTVFGLKYQLRAIVLTGLTLMVEGTVSHVNNTSEGVEVIIKQDMTTSKPIIAIRGHAEIIRRYSKIGSHLLVTPPIIQEDWGEIVISTYLAKVGRIIKELLLPREEFKSLGFLNV